MTEKSYVPSSGAVLTPYICPRHCAQAIDWYANVFGAREEVRYVEPDGRVGHAEIKIDGAAIMLSDGFPDYGVEPPPQGNTSASFALNVYVPDVDACVAAAEKGGANVQRPAEEQDYGARLATFVDPFGVRWMVATHIRDVSQGELDAQAREYLGAEAGPVE